MKFILKEKDIPIYFVIFTLIFIAGFALRLKLFIYNPSLFKDEANLALNIIQVDNYLDFFKPLQRLQVASPIFLILSKFFYSLADFQYLTPFWSDMLLRVVPFISGVLLIPAFGLLVYKIYKKPFDTAFGMLIIAFLPLLVTFSVNFKQYSFEALITVLILLITLNINLKKDSLKICVFKFILLGATLYFSMTAVFILPGSIIYLFLQAQKYKQLKKFLYGVLAFLIVLLVYYITFLHNIICTHRSDMIRFWGHRDSKDFYCWLGIAICSLFYHKNREQKYLFAIPLIITFMGIYTNNYPGIDRLFIFIIPVIVLSIINLLGIIYTNKHLCNKNVLIVFLTILIPTLCIFTLPIENYRYRDESGRELWNDMIMNLHTKNPIILGRSSNSNNYYNTFYNKNYIRGNSVVWKDLPDGKYVYIATTTKYDEDFMDDLKNKKNIMVLDKHLMGDDGIYFYFEKFSD